MKKLMLVVLGIFVLGIEMASAQGLQTILSFGTMIGVSDPFIGSDSIRGVPI